MKKTILLFTVAAFALVFTTFTSCVSIPEPSEKNQTMVYSLVDYYGEYDYSKSKVLNIKSGIKMILENINTNRSYTLTSNSKGEFIKTGLPEGYYSIKEISCTVDYLNRKWTMKFTPEKKSSGSRFIVKSGVTNIGEINIKSDLSNNKAFVTWGSDFDDVKFKFSQYHPDSGWNDQDWKLISGEEQY